mgnify:FL=1
MKCTFSLYCHCQSFQAFVVALRVYILFRRQLSIACSKANKRGGRVCRSIRLMCRCISQIIKKKEIFEQNAQQEMISCPPKKKQKGTTYLSIYRHQEGSTFLVFFVSYASTIVAFLPHKLHCLLCNKNEVHLKSIRMEVLYLYLLTDRSEFFFLFFPECK